MFNTMASATATVTVTQPPPPPPPPPKPPKKSLSQRLAEEVQDAYFDFDKFDIRPDARETLTRNASALRSILADFPGAVITIEGHCDERGSASYNLALGEKRAKAAAAYLTAMGIEPSRIETVSYGKERPLMPGHTEEAYAANRRAHFVIK